MSLLELKKFLIAQEEEILKDLSYLISCQSYQLKPEKNAPFGKGVKSAFAYFEKIAKRDHFKLINYDNFALSLTIGQGKKKILILHHLDVVPIYQQRDWKSNPFKLREKDRIIYGRGVNDNKGPLIYSYYLLKFLAEDPRFISFLNLKNFQITLVIGGAEETTWAGINYYQKIEKQEPDYAISPDGNYPVVCLEMGQVNLQIKYHFAFHNKYWIIGYPKRGFLCPKLETIYLEQRQILQVDLVKSRNPDRLKKPSLLDNIHEDLVNQNKNLEICQNIEKLKQWLNSNFQCRKVQDQKGQNTFDAQWIVGMTNLNANNQTLTCDLTIYYKKLDNLLAIKKVIEKNKWEISKSQITPCHYVNPQGKLVTSLHQAYCDLTNSASSPQIFRGKSYARAFINAVAFGVTFPGENPQSHQANENQKLDSLIKSTLIIFQGLINLLKKE